MINESLIRHEYNQWSNSFSQMLLQVLLSTIVLIKINNMSCIMKNILQDLWHKTIATYCYWCVYRDNEHLHFIIWWLKQANYDIVVNLFSKQRIQLQQNIHFYLYFCSADRGFCIWLCFCSFLLYWTKTPSAFAVCIETSRSSTAEDPEKHLCSPNTQSTGKPHTMNLLH